MQIKSACAPCLCVWRGSGLPVAQRSQFCRICIRFPVQAASAEAPTTEEALGEGRTLRILLVFTCRVAQTVQVPANNIAENRSSQKKKQSVHIVPLCRSDGKSFAAVGCIMFLNMLQPVYSAGNYSDRNVFPDN